MSKLIVPLAAAAVARNENRDEWAFRSGRNPAW